VLCSDFVPFYRFSIFVHASCANIDFVIY